VTRAVDRRRRAAGDSSLGSQAGRVAKLALASLLPLALLPSVSAGHAEEKAKAVSRHEVDAPLGSPGSIRALLRAAGLGEIEFVEPERFGAPDTALAWTSGTVVGLALLEVRKERSVAELRQGHLQMFASGCTHRPEATGPPARSIAGYTLVRSTIRCEDEAGGRVTVTTSILDDRDVLTLAHMGPMTEAGTLEETNRALGEELEALLKP
jgi:hypothetical protein